MLKNYFLNNLEIALSSNLYSELKIMKLPRKIKHKKNNFLNTSSGIRFLINCPTNTPIIAGKIANADQPDNSRVRISFVLSETISIRVNAVNKTPIDCINVSLRNPIA